MNAKEHERQQQAHRRAWFVLLATGILLLFLFNLIGFSGWVAAIFLTGLVALYYVTARKQTDVSTDTKGDGVYYLGLLFTFASLVAALVAFTRQDADAVDTGALIGNFGIALMTSIAGLAGRVLFSMWQEAPGDSVAAATRGLDEAIGDMKAIVVRGGQRMEDLVGHLGESATALEKTATHIAATAERAADTADTMDEYSGKVAGLARSFTGGATELGAAMTAISRGVSDLKEPLEHARGGVAGLSNDLGRLGGAVEQVEATALKLDRAGRDAEREVKGVASRAEGVRREMEKMQAGFSKSAAFFDGTERTVAAVDDYVARIGSSVGAFAEEAAKLQRAAARAMEAVGGVGPKLEGMGSSMGEVASELEATTARAASLGESLSELSDAAVQGREEMNAVSGRVRDLEGKLAGAGTETEAMIGRAGSRADSVAADLDGLRDQLTETQKQLSEITRDSAVVAKKLRRRQERWRRFIFWRRRSKRQ